MRKAIRHGWFAHCALVAAVAAAGLAVAGTASAGTITGQKILVPHPAAPVAGPMGQIEIRPGATDEDPLLAGARVPRGTATTAGHGRKGSTGTASDPQLVQSFNGLDFFQQRYANGGNQFSVEPPDQGLCVGNGMVVEVVNSVYQVFGSNGQPLTQPIDINSLFGYPAQFNRTTGQIGPDVFDPSCLYDAQTNTFFVVASVLAVDSSGNYTGNTSVDILVGQDPAVSYTRYSIDTTNDGNCTVDGTNPGPCFPDYPHIGADANGFYVTTNNFDFFGPNYDGVNIYALPKTQLATAPFSTTYTRIDTNGYGPAEDGGQVFTAIPSVSPGTDFQTADNGTEYFAASRAVFTNDGTSSSLNVLRLTNTASLATTPDLHLSNATVDIGEYGVPAPAVQKNGTTLLASCIGSSGNLQAFHAACWQVIGTSLGFTKNVNLPEGVLDPIDSRVGGLSFADGKLWGDLGSAATDTKGNPVDGVAWFVLDPSSATPAVVNDGMLVKDSTNLILPSIAATTAGKAAIGITIVGPHDYPSAGYVGLSADHGPGTVLYAAPGAGPQDGFSEYAPYYADGSPRPRWGDYGAAVADGSSVWVASEYIGQSCTFGDYLKPSPSNTAAFGTCGDTRAALGNWYTRISQLIP